jgi:hypothetical protein
MRDSNLPPTERSWEVIYRYWSLTVELVDAPRVFPSPCRFSRLRMETREGRMATTPCPREARNLDNRLRGDPWFSSTSASLTPSTNEHNVPRPRRCAGTLAIHEQRESWLAGYRGDVEVRVSAARC